MHGGRGRGAAATHLGHGRRHARPRALRRRALCLGVRRAVQHAPPRHLCRRRPDSRGQGRAATPRQGRPRAAGRCGGPRHVGHAQVDGGGDGAPTRAGGRAHRRRRLPALGQHRAGPARPQRARVAVPLAARAHLRPAVVHQARRRAAGRGAAWRQACAHRRWSRGGGGGGGGSVQGRGGGRGRGGAERAGPPGARGVRRDPQAPRAPCGTLKPARPAALHAEPVQRHGRVVPSAGAPGMTGGPRQRCRFRPVGE
mmetsp:Transcript_35129/g.83883  ORF Transcript_35129/g.83883 Transcript_35129/m.83883 type:complete len:255 (-) Transcript_35129:139-903(-)